MEMKGRDYAFPLLCTSLLGVFGGIAYGRPDGLPMAALGGIAGLVIGAVAGFAYWTVLRKIERFVAIAQEKRRIRQALLWQVCLLAWAGSAGMFGLLLWPLLRH